MAGDTWGAVDAWVGCMELGGQLVLHFLASKYRVPIEAHVPSSPSSRMVMVTVVDPSKLSVVSWT